MIMMGADTRLIFMLSFSSAPAAPEESTWDAFVPVETGYLLLYSHNLILNETGRDSLSGSFEWHDETSLVSAGIVAQTS